ncbi:cell lysis protein-like protein [Bimuria novae-zelandiae CBS 107.79]|uniref:Reticulon-like protein n=1 Tax=Bimuria novae-zelandiae CBS 107.79 TaxID=1447943 RepID=A0A6A5V179_9PLEO|nr:cell lysis protein-like protein [Bimuria novae-zelandiae CBS 107.79]
MTTPNNLNTNPLVLSEDNSHNGRWHETSANGNANANANGSSMGEHAVNAKNSLLKCKSATPSNNLPAAQSAMASVNDHPATQDLKNTVVNGPVAEKAKAEATATRNEFADLANSRTTPGQPAATGQPLTHYHSLFYRLLSWKNPRATALSFTSTLIFIFAARYLNLFRYILKAAWVTFGTTAAAELAGQLTIGKGFTSQFRPRQYFTIQKASLERLTDDIEQFINFFVIESQRIVFAENVYTTIAAFFASLAAYFLIKFVPLWGLALIATTVAYLGPLVYIKNKEVIDAQLEKGYNLANRQATQLRDLAAERTGNATKLLRESTQQYTAKAQETINNYRGRSASPEVKREDFPSAPKAEPVVKEEPASPKPVAEPAL